MRKSSALILSLVTVLSSCSGRNIDPIKDGIFAEARRQYSPSQKVKDEVAATFSYYQSVVKYFIETKEYLWNGTEYVLHDTISSTQFIRTTVNNNYSAAAACVLIEHETSPYYDPSALNSVTSIKKVGEAYQYDIGPAPTFMTDAAKAYEILKGAVYGWNASFFSAASYYLISANGTESNMPVEALEAFKQEFFLTDTPEFGVGSFNISTIPLEMEYEKNGMNYIVKGFESIYKKYLLNFFTGTAFVESFNGDLTAMYETTVQITTEETIKYVKL